MLIYTNHGLNLGNAYFGNFPGWDTWWAVASAPSSNIWESPPSANTAFYGNLTAFDKTANPALEAQYTDNIQALNAKYLPMIVLSYPGYLWVGNKAHWSGWPSGYMVFGGQRINITALATLVPAGATTTTSNSGPTTTSVQGGGSGSTVTTQTTSNTAVTTTSSSSSSGLSTLDYAAIAIVIIVIIAIAGVMALRRGKPAATT